MEFSLKVSPRAQEEIEKIIEIYISSIENSPNNFIIELGKVYGVLKINPFFRIRYKNVRSLKIKKYPYSIYFVVNENIKTIKIISCFHNKRNPETRPNY